MYETTNPTDDDIDSALDAWLAQWHLTELEPMPEPCPWCGADDGLEALGQLGPMVHHRCRYCGGESSTDTQLRQEN